MENVRQISRKNSRKQRNKLARLLLIWDKAGYQSIQEMQEFLEQQNEGLFPDEWRINWELFAPQDSEENSVEAIWLKLKNWFYRP